MCLALFTLAISSGCRGLISISDWLHSYQADLLAIFCPPKHRLPSYSTLCRVLLRLDYKAYSLCLAKFFEIEPLRGETIALAVKGLFIILGAIGLATMWEAVFADVGVALAAIN
jgi:hypothetical protein